MILEICANSFESAKNAQLGGADRIELCSNLSIGGITPSHETIHKVSQELTIPFFVLIRPRGGNFNYSLIEFEEMLKSIEICKKFGAAGIVSGVLNANQTIDIDRTQRLIEAANPLPFTFHKAFDECRNPFEAISSLPDIGATRILSSGLSPTAVEGLNTLLKLKDCSQGKITIMPGAGINSENITLFKEAGFSEVHSSATKGTGSGNYNSDGDRPISSVEEILKMKRLI